MEKIDLKALQYEVIGDDLYVDIGYIHFVVKRKDGDLQFKLKLYKIDNIWTPAHVVHFTSRNTCPYCESGVYVWCDGFDGMAEEFYEMLKRDPKLRLRFLFKK